MKITICKLRRKEVHNVNQDLQWLGNSLGLFGNRDRDSSCFRIFILLVRKAKRNEIISSDEIADSLNLSRATVVHHLVRLIDSGLVIREGRRYILRERDLGDIIGDIKKDMEFIFSELDEVAKEIDDKLS